MDADDKDGILWDNSLEILTEHFTFVPTCFVDDVINAANGILFQALQGIEPYLEEKVGEDAERVLMDIESLFENAVDKNFDKFEVYVLKNIFCIPKGLDIVLPHYQDFQNSLLQSPNEKLDINEVDENELDLQLKDLRNKILAENYFKNELVKLMKNVDAKQKVLQSFIEDMDNIFEKERQVSRVANISTELSTKIRNLRQLLKKIKRSTRDGRFKEIMGRTDERSLYISSTIAKYLEKNVPQSNLISRSECNVECRIIDAIGIETAMDGLM